MKNLDKSSHNILNRYTARRIEGDTLFARIGKVVCEAECLPRKEFFEAWETARRIRRHLRGGPVLELAAGHGLLSIILLLLDDTTTHARCVDVAQPTTFRRLLKVFEARWPRLENRIQYVERKIEHTSASSDELVVSVHACGVLTDQVLDLALAAKSRVAVLPCCHDYKNCDLGDLEGWMDGSLAIDSTRVARLRSQGYCVATLRIPKEITPKNRLLLGWPENGGQTTSLI